MVDNLGRCECIDPEHKANITVSLQRLIDDIYSDIRFTEAHKEELNKSATSGVGMSAIAITYQLRNRVNSAESTMRRVENTPDCE